MTGGSQSQLWRTLIFYCISVVRAGDYISARIPKCREEIAHDSNIFDLPSTYNRSFFFDREFNQVESAIELIILSKNGSKVLRRDKAVLYNNFAKK